MALTKYAIGELIEMNMEINSDLQFGPDDVRGITITKQIIPTKADVKGMNLANFTVVHPNDFIYNPRTHGAKIGFGFNDSEDTFIISFNNTSFRIKEVMKTVVLPEYLFLHFNRLEWDREACYRSWGSSTEVFTWDALCEMELLLPPIDIQQKYVSMYKAMLANQQSYERGLDDLKLTCDGFIDELRRKLPHVSIGENLELIEDKNTSLQYGLDALRGISIEKKFIETKAEMTGVSLSPYLLVRPNDFAFVSVTSRNGDKISIAMNNSQSTYICSSSYIVFRVKDPQRLSPHYLSIFYSRSEFDRYARYNSWGSARETFSFEDMKEVKIPIPSIQVQESIAKLFSVYHQRKQINEQLKSQIKDICPILIKGSIEEASA